MTPPPPAQIAVDGHLYRVGVVASGDRLTLWCDPDDWPHRRVGTRLRVCRGRGDEWYALSGVVTIAGVTVVRLEPTDRPKSPPPWRPPVGRGVSIP